MEAEGGGEGDRGYGGGCSCPCSLQDTPTKLCKLRSGFHLRTAWLIQICNGRRQLQKFCTMMPKASARACQLFMHALIAPNYAALCTPGESTWGLQPTLLSLP